jgi:arylsulfatase A-like enzyme
MLRGAPSAVIAAVVLALTCVACDRGVAPFAGAPPAGPNVVVIVIDTLRPDHLGFLGYERETAPFLSELASRSQVFTEAVSTSSWTAPSTASLFTGLHPLRHGVVMGVMAHGVRAGNRAANEVEPITLNRLPSTVPTLPERFHDAGYRTYGIAANPNIGDDIGFARGFDRFELLEKRHADPEKDEGRAVLPGNVRWASGREMHEQLSDWRAEMTERDRPFFLYLHFNDVHEPNYAHPAWYHEPLGARVVMAAYDSEIGYLDDVLRTIYEDLALSKDSIVAVLSDHGEAFGEHGRYRHRRGLYGEINRILLMLGGPGVGSGVVPQRVSISSVAPTLL